MKGLRIRTMTLPTHEAIIGSLGGQPTPLPWPEVYTALQTDVADGQMNPVPIIAFAKFDEVQKYLTLTNHIITPYVWFMNAEFCNGLPHLAKKMEVNSVSAAERAKFAAAAQPAVTKLIEDKFGAEGKGMLEALLSDIKANSGM